MLRRSVSADRHAFAVSADGKPASLNRRRSVSFTLHPTTRPQSSDRPHTGLALGDAWRSLSDALLRAFAESTAISPTHAAMRLLAECDWQRVRQQLVAHETWDECYTRNPVLESDDFVVMLMCWSPGCCSPVHAHSDAVTHTSSNCFMLVLDGELTETRYPPDALVEARAVDRDAGVHTVLRAGQTAYINDDIGVHKVANSSSSQRALSLHVYAPKWSAVPLYDEVELDGGGAPLDLDAWGDF